MVDVASQISGGPAEVDELSTYAFSPPSSNHNSDCPRAALADSAKRHLDARFSFRSMGQPR